VPDKREAFSGMTGDEGWVRLKLKSNRSALNWSAAIAFSIMHADGSYHPSLRSGLLFRFH
jgi:hypothetical protein